MKQIFESLKAGILFTVTMIVIMFVFLLFCSAAMYAASLHHYGAAMGILVFMLIVFFTCIDLYDKYDRMKF